jgi:hypothetical protein
MSKKKPVPKELVAWRKRHFDELESNLIEAQKIRNGTGSEKNRLTAIHEINLMLGIARERAESPKKAPAQKPANNKPALKPEHKAALEELIGKL